MKMRSENEDQCLELRSKPEDTNSDSHKKSNISYSREFLFSFARFDTCKKLPTGFDSSILGELHDQSTSVLHSYHDSDASRFQSSPSLSSWRNPEKGLLGSGAFARVHRDVAETFAPVVQGSGFHLLNRSSEPYRPPHLCREKYFLGRESKDHCNDETFGSPDNLSQERADEEKMRRDSFELMRKERETVTQEKQKIIFDDHIQNFIDIVQEDSGGNFDLKEPKPCDIKVHSESQFKGRNILAVGEKKKTPGDQVVIEYDSAKKSFGTNGSDHSLMESARTPILKETSTELYGHCNPGVHSSHINGHYSTQHLNGRSKYNVEDASCSYNDEESQNLLSLLRKEAGLTELAESSKLNIWSLDKSYISENEIDDNMPNNSGRECRKKFEKNLHGPISRTLVRDSKSITLTGTGQDLTSKIKWDDSGKSQSPLPVGDNCMIPLPANESGSIEDVEGIAFLKFLKQNGASKRESDLLLSNLQTKGELDLQGGPESKNSSLSDVDELEICLPDEDSLITGTEKDLTSRFKWEDSVKSRAPLLVGDNCMIPFPANESGSIEDVEGIAFLRFLKQNGARKRESDLLLSNLQTKGELDLQGGSESKNSSLSNFDELEICLPDEDSLITGTEKDLTCRFMWEDSVKSRTSLPVGNNCIIPLLANESGSIEDVEGIAFLSFLKQNGASKRESDLLLSNLQTTGEPDLQGEPESKNSSLSNFDELEICLPDEDSLITVDDYMLPQDSLFVNAGGTSSAAVNTIGRLSYPGVAAGDNRFDLAGFESSASFHDSRDLMSSETSFNSLHMQQSIPQLHNPQRKPSTAGVSHSKSQESQKGSIIKPKNLKSYAYNIQSVQHFPTNVHHTPSQHFLPAATRFDHRGNHHLLHESPVQGYFPSQQMYGQPRIAFPQHTSHEMACYEQNQNAMLNSSRNFNRQFYNYIENASSRSSEMGIENKTDLSSFFGWPYAEFL